MQPIQEIRNEIDDHVQIGYSNEVGTGVLQVIQINARNFWDLTITDDQGELMNLNDVELYPMGGQLKGIFPQGELKIEYLHAAFTDAEIEYYLAKYQNSILKTALRLVGILVSSAAKRFDYKAGIKDIKASQVFEHLKDLKADLQARVDDETDGGGDVGRFVERLAPEYMPSLDPHARWRKDTSRSDS